MRTPIFPLALGLTVATVAVLSVGCGATTRSAARTAAAQPASYEDAPYKKLVSEAFVDEFDGKGVHFKAMFVGEWTITQTYRQTGIDTDGQVFINHRDISYVSQETGLGSSDMAFPGFPLSIPKAKSNIVYEMNRGDVFEVWGRAVKSGGLGKIGLYIMIDRIQKSGP